jgi:peptidase M28-like protein
MKNRLLLLIGLSLISLRLVCGQDPIIEKGLQSINQDVIKAQLGFLSSDWTEGRKTGEKGEYISSDYIASMLQLYGVKPFGDKINIKKYNPNNIDYERSFFQNFILLKSKAGEEQTFKVKSIYGTTIKSTDFTFNVDFKIRPSVPGIEINAPVVFAGYAYKNEVFKYNDFKNLDVKGKFILKIAGSPLFLTEALSSSELNTSLSKLESELIEMGVIGIIEFNPNQTVVGYPELNEFMNMSPSEDKPDSGLYTSRYSIPGTTNSNILIRLAVSAKTANEILKGSKINIEEYIKKADSNHSFLIPMITDKSVYLKTTSKTSQVAVRNIIGIIEGKNPNQVIVLGAHYDHLGINNGYIWNGADDNGSGTVGVMTIAKAIMETGQKPEKTIIIALWTAEEVGLLGSRYYLQNLDYPVKNLKLNVNFDMISRYISDDEPNKVSMTYTSSLTGLQNMTRSNIKTYGIDLDVDYQPSDDPPGGSDHRSFVAVGVPVLRFKPGHRDEYHTPMDESETVNWDIMEKIINISFANVWKMANSNW